MGGEVRVGPCCSGVKLLRCPYKFQHIQHQTSLALHTLRGNVYLLAEPACVACQGRTTAEQIW